MNNIYLEGTNIDATYALKESFRDYNDSMKDCRYYMKQRNYDKAIKKALEAKSDIKKTQEYIKDIYDENGTIGTTLVGFILNNIKSGLIMSLATLLTGPFAVVGSLVFSIRKMITIIKSILSKDIRNINAFNTYMHTINDCFIYMDKSIDRIIESCNRYSKEDSIGDKLESVSIEILDNIDSDFFKESLDLENDSDNLFNSLMNDVM